VNVLGQEVRTLFRFEILSLLRDRRTILVSIVLPALLMPFMLSAGRWMEQRRHAAILQTSYLVGICGPEAALADSLTRQALASPVSGDSIHVDICAPGVMNLSQLNSGLIDVLVGVFPSATGRQRTIRLFFLGDDEGASAAASAMAGRFQALRDSTRASMLAATGVAYVPDQSYVTLDDISEPWRRQGATLGGFAVFFLLIFLLSGGAVAAIDTIAGERERGTLETLLASSASRAQIVEAKFLAILAVSAATGVAQLTSFTVCTYANVIPSAGLQSLRLTPWALLQALLLVASLSALVASAMLLVSGRASSVKDAQLRFFPVFLLLLLPGLAPAFPELTATFPFIIVPIGGAALCMREVLAGRADLMSVAAAALSDFALAGLLLLSASRALAAERMLAGMESWRRRTSPAAFPGAVLTIIAVMWAVTTIFSLQAASVDTRIQLAVNLLVILLAGTLLVRKRYGLSWSEHFHFVVPGLPEAVLAVPGAVSGALAGIGLFRLVSLVLPVPQAQMQAFADALLQQQVPRWQMLVFLSLLPGFCEELAFRGMLLGGLLRRMPSVLAVVVSALIFGFFHFSWFRMAPTAFLGLLLGSATVLSGSVVPAMIWHALNNALVIFTPPGIDLGAQPPWIYILSALVCAACLYGMRSAVRTRGERG